MSKKINPEEIAALINEAKNEQDEVKVQYELSDMRTFIPKTENQKVLQKLYKDGFNIFCDGIAGVGKTFCAINLAFEEVLNPSTPYDSITIIRTAVSTRDIGFLPGDESQKLEVLEKPYYGICDEIFGNKSKNNYKALKNNGYINFFSSSFIRGITVRNSIVILDECQNFNYHELKSAITRLGDNSKIILCGDYNQSDLIKSKNDVSGINKFKRVLERMESVEIVTFDKDDIVRGGIVKDFYLAELEEEEYLLKKSKELK